MGTDNECQLVNMANTEAQRFVIVIICRTLVGLYG